MTQSWDLIVIGGGSGGLACAQRAARHGARAAVAEPGPPAAPASTSAACRRKSCTTRPTSAHAPVDAADYGFTLEPARHDWAALKARRDAYVEKLRGIYLENLERRGATLFRERAHIEAPGRVRIGGTVHAAKHIVVATGGQPLVPELPGAEAAITSDGFFALGSMPRSVAIIGSGYVAAELGAYSPRSARA